MARRPSPKIAISFALAIASAGARPARAEDPAPQPAPDAGTTATTATTTPADPDELPGEVVEIYDERPDKPFDRDTEVRLTGADLAARGATDLATALALLPDVSVRSAGRGGFNIDIRGARKGEVTILIDGVPVSDPYYGTFDVSTIPVTDIVEIRVATTPQSPIDGPGGPGGVIEVHTRDAIGPQLVLGRASSDTLPSFGFATSARAALAEHVALRLSGAGEAGARDFDLPGDATLGEQRHAATGAARLEYRAGDRRVVADAFVDDRHYVAPPSDENVSTILMIDRQTSARAGVQGDDKLGALQLQGRAYVDSLTRRSRWFQDAMLGTEQQQEDLAALRVGAAALATRNLGKDARWAASATVDHESADVTSTQLMRTVASHGDVTDVELAADGQYEHGPVRVDGAAGLAAPLGVGADPWPEAKLDVKWRAHDGVLLTATAGRKGRVPSLRERFDAIVGNPTLGPEISDHAELRAAADAGRVHLELAPFYRHTDGLIRAQVTGAMSSQLVNLGVVDFTGVDASARAAIDPRVELTAAYEYVHARSADGSTSPLDFLPHHRVDGTVRVTPHDGWGVLARARWISDQIDGGNVVPAYVLVEGDVSAQLGKTYFAMVRVDDLLDARPEIRFGYHGPGRVVTLLVQGTWD